LDDARTLLQRLRDHPPRRGSGLSTLQESIRESVETLLQTRTGDSLAEPEFGMPDVASVVRRLSLPLTEGGVDGIAHELREVLRRYEPRLAEVRVEVVHALGDPGILVFHLSGKVLTARGEAGAFHGEARVNIDGGVGVELSR
jgi:type VI secretion system lysozyme-like protein